ncbi:MAG: CHASE4 domain-containing protein, partial [Chthoniobacteraceae bacterium]
MTLRTKILLITALTLAALFTVVAWIGRAAWYTSFDALEAERVEVDVERVAAALAEEIDKLHSTARDWAEWDESYAFVEDGNEAYAKSNLTDDTFE